jgi:hypothetical protein
MQVFSPIRGVALLALLTVVYGCGGGDAASLTFPDNNVATVRVEPLAHVLQAGEQHQFSAIALNGRGERLSNRGFAWTSSASTIATVDIAGMVTAIAPGTVTITATTAGVSGSASLVVNGTLGADSVVARIDVTPSSATIAIGATVSLGARAFNAAGDTLFGKQFSWSSASPAIASVNASGTVTAVSAGGPVTITASSGGKSATAAITVSAPPTSVGTITVNGAQQFQRMTGWEVLGGTGYGECDRVAYSKYMPELIARAADELKLNRLKLPLRGGYEQTFDGFLQFQSGQITYQQYQPLQSIPANDNNDPFVINPAGFQWGHLDFGIEQTLLPLKQRLQALGDDLWFTLNFNSTGAGAILYRDNPEEYAEFVLAAFQHMKQKYNLVPNSLEIANEPNLGVWTAQHVAANLLAVKRRLNQAGFFPDFVGPSHSGALGAVHFFDSMIQIPGVAQALSEVSYHKYGGFQISYLQDIWQRASTHGLRTAMTEHIGSGYIQLHDDLTIANVSAWEQFSLAFCVSGAGGGGGLYFVVHNALPGQTNPSVVTASTSTYLRQYFRYVYLNAVRVGASTSDQNFAPVAFRNPNGRYTVVVKALGAGSFTVGGLPAGTYGIEYTTATDYARSLPDVTINGSTAVSVSIPAAGALTVYAK